MMDVSLTDVRGIGPARVKALEAAGITTVRRLLCCLPVEYRDLTRVTNVGDLRPGEPAALSVQLAGSVSARYVGRLHITRVKVTDGTGTVTALWYNQPWLKQTLQKSESLLLYGHLESGKSGLCLMCPSIERERAIVPVYKSVAGIPPRAFGQCIASALSHWEGQWPDELPESLKRRYVLCERNFAMREAHAPTSMEALREARRRLAFEELLLYQLALWLLRGAAASGAVIACPADRVKAYWESLPYPPTFAQAKVLHEIAADLEGGHAMARLVQGDVGCGKTAVAFGGLYLAAMAGFQGAMMAPTEVLARQHFESAREVLGKLGVTVGLLTGSLPAKEKRAAHEAIESGAWQVVIGTHALISQGVVYRNLGLVVTDEQHRFGVRQRAALTQKGEHANVLVMSATPIPRTLSLILYGDLDISVIDELPPGRTPVATRIVPEDKREAMYGFIRREIESGRQAYIVCPLVEESEAVDAKPAQVLYEELKDGPLAGLTVGLAHGKMKPADLEKVLGSFHAGEVQALVATTVVEVGVNVPNASVMVVENAERFGLAQLHQLRGRVGRGAAKSWCFLMASEIEKLRLLTQTGDGFIIAQKDLETRGAGDLFGYRQSGLALPGAGAFATDAQLLAQTHQAARDLMKNADSPEAKQVISLARETFDERLKDISVS